ncbi:uncharacterized protein LOC143153632 [Ptiloglossa arizonensis]|uniref:uncharacterized protein LOC143153632 n=1 Tax=Ptiloglossa arizonensis TaxID=3350558 RepID=UPI003F9FC3D6
MAKERFNLWSLGGAGQRGRYSPPRPDYNQPFYPRLSMSLISIITQTLKSQYPLPAERSNLQCPVRRVEARYRKRESDRTKENERPRLKGKEKGTGCEKVGGSGWIEIKLCDNGSDGENGKKGLSRALLTRRGYSQMDRARRPN